MSVVLKNMWKLYGKADEVEAVRNLNLEVRDGEYLVLLGPSGCGKSSTLRCIAGLERVSSGEIYIQGRLVNSLEPRNRDVAMAFENYALYPPLTVRENLAFPLRVREYPEARIDDEVSRIARLLEIEDVLSRRPRELSGGQKQRVSLGRALIRRPAVFLLDEPLSHLDAAQRVSMRARLKRLQHELGVTTIHVTHDQLEAVALADRIAVMNNGELQQVGSPDDIYDRPANEFVADFIGEPPINLVSGRLEAAGNGLRFVARDGSFGVLLPDEVRRGIGKQVLERVRLGMRPQDVAISASPDGREWIPGNVYFFEWLGEEGILHVEIGQTVIQVLAAADLPVKEMRRAWIRPNPTKLHLFDEETTLAIR